MRTDVFLIVTLGLSGLAAAFVVLFTPGHDVALETSSSESAQAQTARQKPAFVHQSQPDDLPIIEDPGPPLSLERFRSTRLAPEVLKRDIELFSNSSIGTAQEFRVALSHHFPTHELSMRQTGPEVLQCLKDSEESFDGLSFLQSNNLGRIAPSIPLIVYIHRVLAQSAPQEERNFFCRVVDSLIRMYGDHSDEPVLRVYLMQMVGDNWTGWVAAKGQGADAASAIWRSSEVFRHLAYGEPPVSDHFKELVRFDNRRNIKPSSTVPDKGR